MKPTAAPPPLGYDPEDWTVTVPFPFREDIERSLLGQIAAGTVTAPASVKARQAWVFRQVEETYTRQADAYRKAMGDLNDAFRAAMELEHGMAELPAKCRALIHSHAWDEGHAAGYSDIKNHYDRVVDIAKAARA